MKNILINGPLLGALALSFAGALSAAPPVSVADQYETRTNKAISDEFNSGQLDRTKWGYRNHGSDTNWDPRNVYFVKQGNTSFLSLRGQWSSDDANRSSSGISSLNETQYGFYEMRWRIIGFPKTKRSPWHPAAWFFRHNAIFGNSDSRRTDHDLHRRNLEIDFFEFYNTPSVQGHTIPHDVKGEDARILQRFRQSSTDWPTDWGVWGLEYNPKYIRFWEQKNGAWQAGTRLWFSRFENSSTRINQRNRSPGYWILSNYDRLGFLRENVAQWTNLDTTTQQLSNSWVHIDYFRQYEYK